MMSPSVCFLLLGLLVGASLGQEEVPYAKPPSAANSNFGAAISNEMMSYFLNLVVPPITEAALSALGPELPQSCCYGSKSHERLYLDNMAIPPESINSHVSVVDGPKVEIYVNFDVTVSYKLCHPETLGTCKVMFPCSGDATLGMETKTKFDIDLVAGPNGGPEVSFKHFDFHLSMKKDHLCFLLQGLLDSAMPFLNIFLNVLLPKVLGPVVHDIPLPHNFTVPGPLPLDIDWSLTEGTGSEKYGLAAQGVLDILLKSLGYDKAPYLPNHPLPLAVNEIKDGLVTFEATDSLFNNIFYTLGHHFKDFEFDTKQNGFKIKFSFPHAPIANFTTAPGNQAAMVNLYTHVSLTKIPLKIAVTSIETAHMALLFNSHGQLNVVFNSLPFWVSAIYFPVKQREKKKKVLARRRGKGKAKRGKKGTK